MTKITSEDRERSRDLLRNSIAEDAMAQFIGQIIKTVHDERIKPLRDELATQTERLRIAIERAEKAETLAEELAEALRHIDGETATDREIIANALAKWDARNG